MSGRDIDKERFETIMNTIDQLVALVTAQSALISQVVALLTSQGTTLSAADQASVNSMFQALTGNNAELESVIPAPSAGAAPAA